MNAVHCHFSPRGSERKRDRRRLWATFALTSSMMVLEAVGGWVSGSLALVSDAGHMLTDAAALLVAILAQWFASRPADLQRTFGFVRVEVLSAFLNGIALLGIAGFIGLEAWKRIMHPEPIRAGLMLGVALVGLLVNIVGMVLLSKSRSINVRAAFLHVASDAFASLGVVAAAVVVWITGYTLFDPLISLGIVIIIVVGAIALIREAVHVLIESVPRHIRLDDVQKELGSVLGVSEVHDLHVWSISHGLYSLSAHLVCSDSMTNNDLILEEARLKMRECFGIEHSTLQIESKRFHECEHTH